MNLRVAFACRRSRAWRRPSIAFVVTLVTALVAYPKDAGACITLLFLASAFYLLLGTALIGLIEGLFVSFVFQTPRGKAIEWCIFANYVSVWACGLIRWQMAPFTKFLLGDHPLDNALWATTLLALVLWILSIVIEWPFLRRAFGASNDAWRRSLKASLAAHVLSAVILLPLSWLVSDRSLMAWHRDATLPSHAPTDSFIYYTDQEGRVWRSSYDGDRSFVAGPFAPGDGNSTLEVALGSDGATNDVVLVNRLEGVEKWRTIVVPHLSTERPRTVSQDWNLHINYDGSGSMTLYKRHTRETQNLGWDTPPVTVWLRNAVEIGGNRIVFVANGREIVLADAQQRTFAPIARGMAALVVRKGIPVHSNNAPAGNDLEW